MIIESKLKKSLKWADVARTVGHSKEWTTAALLGQMTLSRDEAVKVGALLDLPEEAIALLQVIPYKGSLPTATSPLYAGNRNPESRHGGRRVEHA